MVPSAAVLMTRPILSIVLAARPAQAVKAGRAPALHELPHHIMQLVSGLSLCSAKFAVVGCRYMHKLSLTGSVPSAFSSSSSFSRAGLSRYVILYLSNPLPLQWGHLSPEQWDTRVQHLSRRLILMVLAGLMFCLMFRKKCLQQCHSRRHF